LNSYFKLPELGITPKK